MTSNIFQDEPLNPRHDELDYLGEGSVLIGQDVTKVVGDDQSQ